MNAVISTVCLGFLLLCLCNIGESLQTENNELVNSLYDLPWYTQDLSFRRSLVNMIRQAERPFVINYHLQQNLNLNTFMTITNTSYSYLMMLKSTV